MSENISKIFEVIVQNKRAIGAVLQVSGTLFMFGSHAWFYWRAKKRFGSLKKAFYDHSAPRWGMSEEEFEKAEPKEVFVKFPLARLLYNNYRNSFVGAALTLVGVIISLWNT